ncbi:MAG: hypothetical protein ACE5JK_05470, partial [Candidatus Omnitrophota bacterium]
GIKILERVSSVITGEEIAVIERIGGGLVAFFRAFLMFGLMGMLLLLIPMEFLQDSVKKQSKTGMFFVELDAKIYSSMTGHFGLTKKRTKGEILKEFLQRSENETA